jgi:hypothetical protein
MDIVIRSHYELLVKYNISLRLANRFVHWIYITRNTYDPLLIIEGQCIKYVSVKQRP